MSWSGTYQGPADAIEIAVAYDLGERQKEHKAAAEEAAKVLAAQLGDCHVRVNASGHANSEPSFGDQISVGVSAINAEPEGETPKFPDQAGKTGWGR